MAPAETRTLSAASQPDLIGAGRIASADGDAVEALRIGVAGRLAQLGPALAHALLQHHEILELTRVAGERLDLEVHDLADVHDDVRILPLHDVDFAHLVGLELRHQLGEREMVARERVHAIQRDAADDTVVAVRGAELVGAQGVLADEEVGAVAPDLAGDVAAQLARILDLAVRAELAVVGMGGDHQYAPDGIAHALGRLPSNVYSWDAVVQHTDSPAA